MLLWFFPSGIFKLLSRIAVAFNTSDRTPEFIPQLIEDFPNDNYEPKIELLDEIDKNGIIDNITFLDSLDPHPPILIEI